MISVQQYAPHGWSVIESGAAWLDEVPLAKTR